MSHGTRMLDDDGREWLVFHNGDWSGDVTIHRREAGKDVYVCRIPAAIIRKACAAAVLSDLTAIIEQWDGTEKHAQAAVTLLSRTRK
jgi:hypothetical protein